MILLVIAMDAEAKLLSLVPSETDGLWAVAGTNVNMVRSGIGKVNAAMALERMIGLHHIEKIYNIGFAGATPSYQLHDVVLVEEASYHDFDLSLFGYAVGQVPGYPAVFASDHLMNEEIKTRIPAIKGGILRTGDRFMKDSSNQSFLADMEGTALFQVAHHHGIPMASIKIVSDIIGSMNHEDSYLAFEAADGGKSVKRIVDMLFLSLYPEVS